MTNNLVDKVSYTYYSSKVITDSLRKGCDVVQFCNGDIITTQVIIVSKEYKWSKKLGKLIEITA